MTKLRGDMDVAVYEPHTCSPIEIGVNLTKSPIHMFQALLCSFYSPSKNLTTYS